MRRCGSRLSIGPAKPSAAPRSLGPHDHLRTARQGFTKLHPDVPEKLRGTYAGLGVKEVIDYIKSLGVTSVELLPDSHLHQ